MPVLIIALGMTLVILTGQIDISVGSLFAVCGRGAGVLAKAGLPMPLVVARVLRRRACSAIVNGALVAYVRIPSIVVTLATMVALRDGLRWATERRVGAGSARAFQWLGLAAQRLSASSLLVAAGLLRSRSRGGCANLPPGGRSMRPARAPDAARLAGIRHVERVTFGVFVVLGALTGLAALLNSVRFNQIPSNAGLGLELKVIAAVVVGGTAITGGRGTARRHAARRRPARRDRPGADVPRRQRVLGARDPGRDHPRGGRRSTPSRRRAASRTPPRARG